MELTFARVDFDVLTEALIMIVVLAFFIERALSLIFEQKYLVDPLSDRGLKEPIALLVSYAVVRYWHFDALAIIFQAETTSVAGLLITAAVIAGGSKASLKLFQ